MTHLDLFLCWNVFTLELMRPAECWQSVIVGLRDRFETPHGTNGWTVLLFEAGGGGTYQKNNFCTDNKERKTYIKKWYVGEVFQLTKFAPKLQIQVAQNVFLGALAKDVNRPIIWDCSHARNFAPVRTEIIILHYGR